MNLSVLIDPEAREEFESAFDYYEARQSGLGWRFARALGHFFEKVIAFPELYQPIERDIRQGIVAGFPYFVFYRVEKEFIRVLAILHASRDPRLMRSRLS